MLVYSPAYCTVVLVIFSFFWFYMFFCFESQVEASLYVHFLFLGEGVFFYG